MDTEDLAIKDLWNPETLRDEIRILKNKLNEEKEEKSELKLQI